jgi:hypothetical protein
MSTVLACIRLDISTRRADALQSSRRIQHSNASIRTTWQYHSDASQCPTSKRISFVDTDMGGQLQPSGRQVHTVRTLSLIGQDMKKNCNYPDVRVTPSRRSHIQERKSTLYEKPVAQFTVRMALACIRTPPRENHIRLDLGLL